MSFALITDSASNLTDKELNEYNIEMVSYHVNLGGQDYLCYEAGEDDVTRGKDFYAQIRNGADVMTSLVNPEQLVA